MLSGIKLQERKQPFRSHAYDFSYELEICAKQSFFPWWTTAKKGTQIKRDGWLQKTDAWRWECGGRKCGRKKGERTLPAAAVGGGPTRRNETERGERQREEGGKEKWAQIREVNRETSTWETNRERAQMASITPSQTCNRHIDQEHDNSSVHTDIVKWLHHNQIIWVNMQFFLVKTADTELCPALK